MLFIFYIAVVNTNCSLTPISFSTVLFSFFHQPAQSAVKCYTLLLEVQTGSTSVRKSLVWGVNEVPFSPLQAGISSELFKSCYFTVIQLHNVALKEAFKNYKGLKRQQSVLMDQLCNFIRFPVVYNFCEKSDHTAAQSCNKDSLCIEELFCVKGSRSGASVATEVQTNRGAKTHS